jgi:hypothetical protein
LLLHAIIQSDIQSVAYVARSSNVRLVRHVHDSDMVAIIKMARSLTR